VREQLALLPGYLSAHLQLTLAALTLGVLCSVPLGVLASRLPRLGAVILAGAGVLQTVPSLALLAVLVPVLAALGAPSIGATPALIGLFLYSLLPVLRNTVTGLRGVDAALIEAARGVGMTPRQQLLQVELPLAAPVILAGVRTSAVWTVGTATLATPVGAESLGSYIFSGLQTRNSAAILVGCAASALLALLLDALLRLLEVGGARRRLARVVGATGLALLFAVSLVPAARARLAGPRVNAVTIGAKTFTEQYILSAVLAGKVRRETGRPARTLDSLGSTVAFDSLRRAQIDAYVDYSGTIWATVLRRGAPPQGPGARAEVLAEVRRGLLREYGVEVAAVLGFENTYALAMRRDDATRRGLRTLSELTAQAPQLRVGADYELFQRPEWRSLERVYGLHFAEQRSMDPSLMYQALAGGTVDLIGAFSSDGRIGAFDLVILEDDRHAIPPYDAIVLLRPRLRQEMPAVAAALTRLDGAISPERMRQMNGEVDEGRASARVVAERFLAGH
jgi:osmoprotectant transport system permease protein